MEPRHTIIAAALAAATTLTLTSCSLTQRTAGPEAEASTTPGVVTGTSTVKPTQAQSSQTTQASRATTSTTPATSASTTPAGPASRAPQWEEARKRVGEPGHFLEGANGSGVSLEGGVEITVDGYGPKASSTPSGSATAPSSEPGSATEIPTSVVDYANALVQAWGAGDWQRLEVLATDETFTRLKQEGAGGASWDRIRTSDRGQATVVHYRDRVTGRLLDVSVDKRAPRIMMAKAGHATFVA